MMLKKLRAEIATQFPEYVELDNLLTLAALTWKQFGISAGELSQMDDVEREMIWIRMANGE